MKTNNYDDDDGASLSTGSVSTMVLIWFLICGGFIAWLFLRIFSGE